MTLAFNDLAHAVVLRSPHAHARIVRIDVAAARALPGVLTVLTAADADADGLKPLHPYVDTNTWTGDRVGIVRAIDVDPDYRFRPEPEKTVEDVKALK
jgi:CO/xanthine dehydrogenase Mo-binding subunit